jgi:iron complex transport system ATP-binding protein
MNDAAKRVATTTPLSSGTVESETAWRLECRDVRVLAGRHALIHDISISIHAGECISIIGPNGAGKTTLLLAMMGIRRLSAGWIRFNERDIATLPARERGRLFAYVPQTLEHAPELTVREVVAAARYPHVPALRPLSASDDQIVDAALARCGLNGASALASRRLSEISGGERQKTLLAAAIAQDARALFLDEPDTALDPAYQIELVRLLRALHAEGRTIVIVSHDLQFPAALIGRVIAMRDGTIAADGPSHEILTAGSLERIYAAPFQTATTPDGRQVLLPKWS